MAIILVIEKENGYVTIFFLYRVNKRKIQFMLQEVLIPGFHKYGHYHLLVLIYDPSIPQKTSSSGNNENTMPQY